MALVAGAAVFSHWRLDAPVHVARLPVFGIGSKRRGLGHWQHMPVALAVEAVIPATGVRLIARGAPVPRGRMIAVGTLAALTLIFTVLGMTLAPAPPSVSSMATSSLITVVAVCAVVYWPRDRQPALRAGDARRPSNGG